jgi:hypothetical protein
MPSVHHIKSDLAPSQIATITSSKMLVISSVIGIALVIIGILGLSRVTPALSFSTVEGASYICCGGILLLAMPLLIAAKEKGNKAIKVEQVIKKNQEKQEEVYLHPPFALKSLSLRFVATAIFLAIPIALITIGALGFSHVLMMKTYVAAIHVGVGLLCSVWLIKHLVDLKDQYAEIQAKDEILQKQLENQAKTANLTEQLRTTATHVGIRVATKGLAWTASKLLGLT